MKNYLVMVRATVATELMVAASSEAEAAIRAQRLFESAHSSKFEMVLGEVIESPIQPLDGGAA